MIIYEYADANKTIDQALLHHLSEWQKRNKKQAKHLHRIGRATHVIDAEMRVISDVVNQINAIRYIKRATISCGQQPDVLLANP